MAVKVRQRRGKWWVFIDHHGKRKAKCVGKSERAAKEVAAKIEAKLTLGQFEVGEASKPVTFKEYAQSWLRFVETRRKFSTHRAYDRVLRYT